MLLIISTYLIHKQEKLAPGTYWHYAKESVIFVRSNCLCDLISSDHQNLIESTKKKNAREFVSRYDKITPLRIMHYCGACKSLRDTFSYLLHRVQCVNALYLSLCAFLFVAQILVYCIHQQYNANFHNLCHIYARIWIMSIVKALGWFGARSVISTHQVQCFFVGQITFSFYGLVMLDKNCEPKATKKLVFVSGIGFHIV